MRKKLFFVIGLLFIGLAGHSQIFDSEKDKYWIDLGFGGFQSIDKITGFTFNVGFNLNINDTQYKVRTLVNTEFIVFASPSEQYYSIGALVGKGFSWKYFQIIPSGGIGLTGGITRGDFLFSVGWLDSYYDKDYFISPSIPLEIDFMAKPLNFMGAGISVFADLNLKRSMYGVTLKIGVGKLR